MPRTYGRLQGIKLKSDFTATLDKKFQVIVRNAARAYIRALILRIPIWTGMAMGSVKFARGTNGNLGAFLNIAIPITPHPRARMVPGKNQWAGGKYGQYSFSSSRHVYRFKFRSDVLHYIHNEFFSRPSNVEQQIVAPWLSQAEGARAFNRSIKEQIAKLDSVSKSLVRIDIPFGI